MGRKNKSGTGISFFSFQDIITSLTGIMLLIVILLVLLILESQESSEPKREEESPAEIIAVDIAALRQRVQMLRSSIEDSKSWLERHRDEINLLLSINHADINRKLADMEDTLGTWHKKIAREQEVAAQAEIERQEMRDAEIENERETLAVNTKNEETATIIDARKSELSKLEEAVSKRQKLSVSLERKEAKEPILVECGPIGIRTKIFSDSQVHDFRDSNAITATGSVNKFLEWARAKPQGKYYYAIFVSPAAFGYAFDIDHGLKASGIERGLEILPKDDSEIF